MNKNSYTQQQNNNKATKVGIYNQQVKDYLANTKLSLLEQKAIEVFRASAQRRRITNDEYNKEVEEFNALHGFLLLKKGKDTEASTWYSYINYPYLDSQSIHDAMTKYRKFMFTYNRDVKEKNTDIKAYNSSVVKNIHELTPKEKQEIYDFRKLNKSLHITAYNELVYQSNLSNPIHPKRKYKQLLQQYSDTFYVLLFFYTSQLKKRNGKLLEYGKPTSVKKNELPKISINHKDLIDFKVNGVQRLNFSKRSAQNHIQVFVEAGLLLNYQFINKDRPVFANFNPNILSILDGKPPKSQAPENTAFFTNEVQQVHKLKYYTRTPKKVIKNEIKIEDCANSTVGKKCGSMQETTPNNYKNTSKVGHKKSVGREKIKNLLPEFLKTPEKGLKKVQKLSLNFMNRFVDDTELAKQLHDNDYATYKGLPYNYLKRIELYAHELTIDEIKTILVQDLVKSAAKIWKNHENPPFVGDWKKAINTLHKVLFKNITTNETLFKKHREYRWKLNFARQWFIRNKVSALYPSMYFDPTRKSQSEIGFFGLHKIYQKHIEYKKQSEVEKKDSIRKSNLRKKAINNNKKLNTAVHKYLKGQFTSQQLFDYVEKNLPVSFYEKLITKIQIGQA